MHRISGGCHCGNVSVEVELTAEPASYTPRACDCDFCRKHGAAWLSDVNGALQIRLTDPGEVSRYRQGSGQAQILLCRNCGVVVGVLYETDGRVRGAVNATALHGAATFAPAQVASPQKLSAVDKAKRWQDLWFPDVTVTGGQA